MHGWRGRLGLIIPANNTVIEPELNRLVPNGVSVHAARVIGTRAGMSQDQAVHAMAASSDLAAEQLAVSRVDSMAYCCMSTGIIQGPEWARQFGRHLGTLTKAPVATAADLTFQALIALGIRRVAILTPYPPHVAERVRPFFAAHGFEVVAEKHMPGVDVHSVNDYPPETAYRLARSLDVTGAEGVCILATDFRTLDVLNQLERDLALPVVSSNQAVLWGGLRMVGVSDGIHGHGRLLSDSPPLPPTPAVRRS